MNFANAQGVENIYMKNDDKIKPRNFIKKEEEILHLVLLKRHGIITTKSRLPMYTVCLLFVYDSETEGRGGSISLLLIVPASNQVPWLFFTHEDTMMSE